MLSRKWGHRSLLITVRSLFLFLLTLTASVQAHSEAIDYKTLYENTAPSVVLIRGKSAGVKGIGQGTGSIITSSGLILTNSHVATNNGKPWDQLYITLKPKEVTGGRDDFKYTAPAKLIAHDPKLDLALITFVTPLKSKIHYLPLSNLSKVGIGEPVVAIGHPGGGQLWTLTTGRISASWKNYAGVKGWDVFQTETALNPGNSGGPLLGGDGAIVGVNTFIKRDGGKISLEGLNFSVKSTTVLAWMDKLLKDYKPQTPAPTTKPKASQPSVNKPKPKASTASPKKVKPQQKQYAKRPIPKPQIKKSEKKYTSNKKSGVVMAASEFKQSFLNDINKEIHAEQKQERSQQPQQPLKQQQQQGRPDNTNSKSNYDKFLEKIDY